LYAAVFGYFSDIIGQVFFPPQENTKAIIESFAVFGLAFLVRPIGGLVMGYIGDTYGRKTALEISIFMMAFPTFLMGCLPSYDQVGSLAIVLLLLTRVLQGLSVGGQLVTSLVFTCENNPRSQWGLYGSYVMAAANFGTLLGGLMSFTMRKNLTEEQLLDWGWRLPFMLGILVSFCGIYLKFYCEDDSIEQLNGVSPPNPIKAAFAKGNRMMLLSATLVPMLWAGGFYLAFVWMATFMNSLIDPPVPDAFEVNSASLLFSVCIFFPFAGWLSDKFDRKTIMYIGGFTIAFFSPLMMIAISRGKSVGAFFAQSFLGIALSLYAAPSK
jgi:MHS family proline/betaine transporter-like MFS transporter